MKIQKFQAIIFSLAAGLLLASSQAVPGNPDNDPRCAVLAGAAFGLCSAAVATGCADAETTNPGCTKVEDNFRKITGDEPPWLEPVCVNNSECAADEFCKKPTGSCEGMGVCETRPLVCVQIYHPVCGCDGVTYDNECIVTIYGVNIASVGTCM